MPKSFSKTGLSIGDRVQTSYGKNNFHVVKDVGEFGYIFCGEDDYDDRDLRDYYVPYTDAIKSRYKILEDEPEKDGVCGDRYFKDDQGNFWVDLQNGNFKGYHYSYSMDKVIKEAIIANNNELIEEIGHLSFTPKQGYITSSPEQFDWLNRGIREAINTIQSKNDLLSKE